MTNQDVLVRTTYYPSVFSKDEKKQYLREKGHSEETVDRLANLKWRDPVETWETPERLCYVQVLPPEVFL